MEIKEVAAKYADYVVEMRRTFHENPELSGEEYETSKLIKAELDKIGVEWRPCGLETGVLATIKGAKPGKTILMRGDMDALPIGEETGLPYASKKEGVMHACGHDNHTAMLLTAAYILNDMREELCGTVKLAFQPSEETGLGAKSMVENGAMEGVDGTFAMHVIGNAPAGMFFCNDGPMAAAARKFVIDIQGKGGHASMPQVCIDPLVCGTAIVQNLQTLVSREYAPGETVVCTIGTFDSGTRWNILPDTAHLEGTTRMYNMDIYDNIGEKMERIIKGLCDSYRTTYEFQDIEIVPPVVNNNDMATLARESGAKILGPDHCAQMPPMTGGEDFAYMTNLVPGALAGLGIANPACDSIYPNHHPKFTVDESVLIQGASIYAQVAMDFNAGV